MVSKSIRDKLASQHDGSARLVALQYDVRKDHACAIKWVPRVLGVLPFVAFLIGILHALKIHWAANGLDQGRETLVQLNILRPRTVVTAVLFIAFVIYREPMIGWISRKLPFWPVGKDPLEKFVWLSLFGTSAIFGLAYLSRSCRDPST